MTDAEQEKLSVVAGKYADMARLLSYGDLSKDDFNYIYGRLEGIHTRVVALLENERIKHNGQTNGE